MCLRLTLTKIMYKEKVMIYKSIDQLIGKTPLVELGGTEKKYGLSAKLIGKVEFFNPAGSVKDRVAREMLDDAERKGILKKDSVVIEPTSGNTGIGLASVAAARGYKVIIVMPDSMSQERRTLMKAYGAELVLTPGKDGMNGAIKKAEEISGEVPGSFIAGQFVNLANPEAHYKTTGPEIWADTDGKVDIFIAGIGTGGTISGVGKYLKSKNPDIKIIGVEPLSSPVLTGGKSGPHKIQGIGAGFVPEILDRSVIDEVVTVSNEAAMNEAGGFGKTEGFLVGISAGAAVYAAVEVAKRPENKDKNIVVLLPDTGDRYLSTTIYDDGENV